MCVEDNSMLLGYAAKAVGMSQVPEDWNPLMDCRQALLLAASLGITVILDEPIPFARDFETGERIWGVEAYATWGNESLSGRVPYGDDPVAAINKAIVVSAAMVWDSGVGTMLYESRKFRLKVW